MHSCRRPGGVSASIDADCSIRSSEPAMITAHTDVVGSLLRPAALRKARGELAAGRLSHAQFKSIEDPPRGEAGSLRGAAGRDSLTRGREPPVWVPGRASRGGDGLLPL